MCEFSPNQKWLNPAIAFTNKTNTTYIVSGAATGCYSLTQFVPLSFQYITFDVITTRNGA